MRTKSNLVALKSIKIGFDISLILLSVFIIFTLVISVINITSISSSSIGNVVAEAMPLKAECNDISVFSSLKGVSVNTVVTDYHLVMSLKSDKLQFIPVLYRIFYFLTLNVGLLFLLFIFYHIRNIVRSTIKDIKAEQNPSLSIQHHIFDNKNIRRLKYIAYGFIAMPALELCLYCMDSYFLSKYFLIEGFVLKPISGLINISWDYLLIGLLFISFIEVIRRGMKLQEENDLTV